MLQSVIVSIIKNIKAILGKLSILVFSLSLRTNFF